MAATKKRAAAGMLRAYRDGELEAIADDLEKKQEALEQKKVPRVNFSRCEVEIYSCENRRRILSL